MAVVKFPVFWATFGSLFALSLLVTTANLTPTKNAKEKGDKVKISLYYESLCGGCIQFDREQLYPLYAKIPDYLDLDLVPYGNAERSQNPDGTWTVECQHGENECRGNKLQACALSKLPGPRGIKFVGCTVESDDPPAAGVNCSKILKLTPKEWAEVKNCTEGSQGDALILANAVRTESLDPPHQWVPWILINGQYDAQEMDESMNDLVGVVCRHLKEPHIPSICNQIDGIFNDFRRIPVTPRKVLGVKGQEVKG